MREHVLEKFFNPQAVAIVGASKKEGSIGNILVKNPARKMMPMIMEVLVKMRTPICHKALGLQEVTAPIFFIPCARSISPTETKTMAIASIDKVFTIEIPFSAVRFLPCGSPGLGGDCKGRMFLRVPYLMFVRQLPKGNEPVTQRLQTFGHRRTGQGGQFPGGPIMGRPSRGYGWPSRRRVAVDFGDPRLETG